MQQISTKIFSERENQYLDFLIDPSFSGVNRLVLSLENEGHRKVHTRYYLPKVEIKSYNVMIDGKNVFDQPVKSDMRTIARVQGDDYITGCLLDYDYSKKHYKMIARDLSKQQALDAAPKAVQPNNFTGNLRGADNRVVFFIIKETKETILGLSRRTVKVM